MSVKINSNTASLTTQRYLAQAVDRQGIVFERLSSGLRINKASDDAAGLAIGLSLGAQGRVYGQSLRNLNDAVSAVNIADGAIANLSDIVIRLEELATQSANGSFSEQQRLALNTEGQALRDEYNRIVNVTSFNGVRLLDGSSQNTRIQAGTTDLSYGLTLDPTIATQATAYIGDGTFQAILSSGEAYGSVNDVKAGDVNGDGKADLVISDTNSIKVQFGNGDGTFSASVSYVPLGTANFFNLADVNNDSHLDVVVANRGMATVGVLINNGNGTFKAVFSSPSGAETEDVIAVNVNGDSFLDLIAVSSTEATVSVIVGNGDGTFKARVSYNAGASPGTSPYQVQDGDLNGDGAMDLVVNETGLDVFYILYGNGNGTFKARVSFATGDHPYNHEVVDVNNDSKLDVLTYDLLTTSLSVRLGNGDGTFKAGVSYESSAGSNRRFQAIDITGDGNKDLVLANGEYFLGNGDGTFKAVKSVGGSLNLRGVAVADFDGDFSLDIAVTGSSSVFTALGNDDLARRAQLGAFSLTTRTDALLALETFKTTLEQIAYSRGRLGAQQSRLSAASRVISAARENYSSARSRIMDADVAQESAELVRTSIVKQGATSILAQANQLPSLALALL